MVRCFGLAIVSLLLFSAVLYAQPITEPAAKYAVLVKSLETFINREDEDKRLPALSIAIVDDQRIIWARGFGFADAARTKPATADTVYRVGSVSKLFTDIAVMQLVEQGKLDLDSPVTAYLPDFKPKNPFDKPITLRMLMAHRSGLVREPPIGSYFHADHPPLATTIESLNGTAIVHEPGSKTKYSNAAVAAVGYIVEKTQKQPFDRFVREHVLEPLGMKKSDFDLRDDLRQNLAEAVMWTLHGREFAAPTFELGIAPAASMYTTVNDLAGFMKVIFADGKGPNQAILKPETLKRMLTPQFGTKEDKVRYGIGFSLGELDGKPRAGHAGAIYGFSTALSFLPEEKIGVVVIAARDFANPVMTRIADEALRNVLAVKSGQPLSQILVTERLAPAEAKKLAGRYGRGDEGFDLVESAGRLWMFPARGGDRVELRKAGSSLITDDVRGFGKKIERIGDKLRIDKIEFERADFEQPPPPPAHFLGLIGEYGWDHNVLCILEKDGKLHALVHGRIIDPLKEIGKDVYAFPDDSPFTGEKLTFTRDRNDKATQVEVGTVTFKRRHLDGEDGKTFRIEPVKSVAELRKDAAKARPPAEKGDFRHASLVEIARLDGTIKLDLRYATDNNFLSVPLYPANARAYMQKPAAEALMKVNAKLKALGYGLLIHDAYRPWLVTKIFWDATPEKFHDFVADPSKGSRHNRGCAVDLTLYDLASGKPIEMVGGFDEFSDRSYPDYLGGTSLQRWHRDLLRRMMEAGSFTVYEAEWWHFDFKDWRQYAIGNQSFEELEKR